MNSDILEKTKEINDLAINCLINNVFSKSKPTKAQLDKLKPIILKLFLNYKKLNMNALISHHCPLPKEYSNLKKQVLGACAFYSKKVKEGERVSFILVYCEIEVADIFNTLFDNYIGYDSVYVLLKVLINKVFPLDLLGEWNMQILHLSI